MGVSNQRIRGYDVDIIQPGDVIHFKYPPSGIDNEGEVDHVLQDGPMIRIVMDTDTIHLPEDRVGDGSYTIELVDWPGNRGDA